MARRLLVLALVAVVTAGVAAWMIGGSAEGIDRARSWVDDDAAWATATQSGETLAEIATVLRDEAEASGCDVDGGRARCSSLYRVVAWAETSAVAILGCTRPGVFETRAAARIVLDELADGRTVSEPPPLPTCR